MFILGFILGFLTALALILGVALIPVILLIALGILVWGYYRHRKNLPDERP